MALWCNKVDLMMLLEVHRKYTDVASRRSRKSLSFCHNSTLKNTPFSKKSNLYLLLLEEKVGFFLTGQKNMLEKVTLFNNHKSLGLVHLDRVLN